MSYESPPFSTTGGTSWERLSPSYSIPKTSGANTTNTLRNEAPSLSRYSRNFRKVETV